MPARAYEILEHSADIGFRAFGKTLPDLFSNSALAMLSIAGDPAAAQPRLEYPISVESGDRESLIVDWLNEVLYWSDSKRIAFREFRVTSFREDAIEATGLGEPRNERHHAKLIVKTVTYNQLKVEHRDGSWIAEVYLQVDEPNRE